MTDIQVITYRSYVFGLLVTPTGTVRIDHLLSGRGFSLDFVSKNRFTPHVLTPGKNAHMDKLIDEWENRVPAAKLEAAAYIEELVKLDETDEATKTLIENLKAHRPDTDDTTE